MISSSLLGKELWKSYVGQVQLLLPHHSCICIKSTWAFRWNKQARIDSVFICRVIWTGVSWLNPGQIDRLFLFPRGRRATLCQGEVQLAIRHWRGRGGLFLKSLCSLRLVIMGKGRQAHVFVSTTSREWERGGDFMRLPAWDFRCLCFCTEEPLRWLIFQLLQRIYVDYDHSAKLMMRSGEEGRVFVTESDNYPVVRLFICWDLRFG